MAINVRYAPDYRYSESRSQRSNFRPAEDEPVNPYAMSAGDGARINARLRADRERLGQRQRQEYGADAFKDTEAGFEWQAPIQIYDPAGNYQTGYESLGVDPLRTGGFGRLGTRETKIYDQAGVIDLNDPRDNALVGQIAQRRGSYNQNIDADAFRSPEEMRQIQEDRKFQQFEREQGLRNKLAGQLDEEQYQRALGRDKERAELSKQSFVERQQYEEEAKKRGLLGEAKGRQLSADLLGEPEGLDPAQQANVRKIRSAMASAQGMLARGEIGPTEFAAFMEEQQKRLDVVSKPIAKYGEIQYDEQGNPFQIDPRGQRVYKAPPSTSAQRMQEYIEKRKIIAAEQVAREGRITPQQAIALADQAADNVYRYTGREPSEQEIASEIRRLQAAASSVQQTPVITDPQQALILPSGTIFTDPNGVKRRVP